MQILRRLGHSQKRGREAHEPSPGTVWTKKPVGSAAVGRGGRRDASTRATNRAPRDRASGIASMPVGQGARASRARLLALHGKRATVRCFRSGCKCAETLRPHNGRIVNR